MIRRIWNQQINFIAKKSLFKFPFKAYLKWLGGAPIDRTKSNDTVATIASIFDEHDQFRLALSPEGTREKVSKWKTGFYYIAKKANVPIVMVAFDYKNKQVKVSEPHYPTVNKTADFELYEAFFNGVVGKVPKYSY